MDNDIKEIKEFIKSDVDEAEFFGLSKDNTITLGDYQEKMIDIDRKFQQMAQFEVFSIKRKCNWVKEVWFEAMQNTKSGEFFLSSIHIFTTDNRELAAHQDKKSEVYTANIEVPFFYLLNKGIKRDLERSQELYKIQRELKEIESIGKDVYNGKLYDRKSVSDNFKATYRPDAGLYLFDSNSDNITAYLKENRKNYDKPLVKDKDKVKLLRKVLIKND